jgi:hypothetical protein
MVGENMKEKILLIAPVFFNYYQEMIVELELMGYEVDYICDAPSNSNLSKAIGRINKNLIKGSTKKYFEDKVLPVIKDKKYKDVLIIGGMTFSFAPAMVAKIRDMNPDARFIMYQWDSEKNLPYSTGIHPYINQLYSFDLNDCEKMPKYKFLPLFYTRTYEEIGKKKIDKYNYDCSYVGTAHPQKYRDINAIANDLKEVMSKQYIYHYMPSKLKYIYHKILAPEFKKAKMSDFKTKKLSSKEVMEIFKDSFCILDAPQAGQTGLTIRTIECLGAKRKMITTNNDIKKYDFYNDSNILVFDGEIDKKSDFFKTPFVELNDEIYKKYSLRAWLKYMLKGDN